MKMIFGATGNYRMRSKMEDAEVNLFAESNGPGESEINQMNNFEKKNTGSTC